MAGQAALRVDTSLSLTPSATYYIPVLTTAPTLSTFSPQTGVGAGLIDMDTLRDFFQGGVSDEFLSTVAVATPAALVATTSVMFASTLSGGVLMGFGTTHDVALKNRAGTTVLGVTANTTGVTMAGALAITGALSGVTTLAASGTASMAAITATSVTYTTLLSSVTALVTPGVLAATAMNLFASTVNGAAHMGFGTTYDLSLMNRNGTVVCGVPSNSNNFALPNGGLNFLTELKSTAAYATPSAYAATTFVAFASTVSGATLMGFGTTGDVTLKNRAGTDVLVVTSNTLNVTMAGALAITGALSGVTTFTSTGAFRVNGIASLGTAAGTDQTVIDGTAFGAGAASLRLNGLTTAAVNNQTGTLLNAPVAGNPTFWIPISIAGTIKYVPAW